MFKIVTGIGLIATAVTFMPGTWLAAAGADQIGPSRAAAERFAQPIETAHGLSAWQGRQALQADFTITFGDKTYLKGTMLFDTPVGRVRMEVADGTVLVFDGQDAWISPADASAPSARFDLLTWPYFVAAPMKLRDAGTHIVELGPLPLDERSLPTAKLTFDNGVGDSPDDWYVLFRDPRANRLVAMAYIVTYGGKDLQEAEKEPHAITYHDFETVEGVVISTRWQFWHWDRAQGIHGDPMGQANLRAIQFVEPAPDAFEKPADARPAPLPSDP